MEDDLLSSRKGISIPVVVFPFVVFQVKDQPDFMIIASYVSED